MNPYTYIFKDMDDGFCS